MSDQREQKYCPCCRKPVLAVREGINELLNLACVVLLTVLTGGLILPLLILIWVLWEINARKAPYLCPYCGSECLDHSDIRRQAKSKRKNENKNELENK